MNKEQKIQDKYTFGFWVYLMTDLIMFSVLFAAYAVLRSNTAGGPGGDQLFNFNSALWETLILLTSSFTCGLATLALLAKKPGWVIFWFLVTFVLGISFLTIELREFSALAASGNSPRRSAFLSAFFTLVGTHGLHITVGLLWMVVAMMQVAVRGLTAGITSKIIRLGLFWHFLDIVWIFIFTFVYLTGITL